MRWFSMDGAVMSASPRILIVRLTAMGDVIHGLPVATALRQHFPDSYIAWAVEGRNSELVEGHPDLDQVVKLPRHWWRSFKTLRSIRRELLTLKPDVTVDLQCLTKSSLIAWLSGAGERLGAAGANGREISKWFNNRLTDVQANHAVDHYLGILKPLGIVAPEVEFKFPERQAEADFALQTIAELELAKGPYAILNPGAGWPSKIWPTERYGKVAQHLHNQHGVRSLVVWCGDEELAMAEHIVGTSQGTAVLAPATSMLQLAAITRRSRLFLGSDTGPMHLAVAVGVPTISMHGTSRSEWCGAYGKSNLRLQKYYQSGSARQRRTADNTAMQAISTQQACEACSKLLNRTGLAKAC